MSRINITSLMVALGLLALSGSALAEVQKPLQAPRAATGMKTLSNNSAPSNSNGLYRPVPSMRIAKGSLPQNRKLPAPVKQLPAIDPLILAIQTYKSEGNKLSETSRAYVNKMNECDNRSYSQADQAAAGCTTRESVSECNIHLFNWCTSGVTRTYLAQQDKFFAVEARLFRELDKFKASLGR